MTTMYQAIGKLKSHSKKCGAVLMPSYIKSWMQSNFGFVLGDKEANIIKNELEEDFKRKKGKR